MNARIVPLTSDHLDSAASLFSARHRCDRAHIPTMSSAFEDAAACAAILQELLAADAASGVVALVGGRVPAICSALQNSTHPRHPSLDSSFRVPPISPSPGML